MPNDAFWERNLLHEQQRAQADAHARSDSGTESDDNLPIASTLATNTNEKIVPHAADLDGAMPRPKGLKKKTQPHQRWEYVPVIPDQEIASQYWDTLPSSVRVARDAGNVKLRQCIEDENQPVGGEADATEANGVAVNETEANGAAVDETEANGTSEVRDSRTGDSSTPIKLRNATKRKVAFQPFPFP
jgi:hypothetical protein